MSRPINLAEGSIETYLNRVSSCKDIFEDDPSKSRTAIFIIRDLWSNEYLRMVDLKEKTVSSTPSLIERTVHSLVGLGIIQFEDKGETLGPNYKISGKHYSLSDKGKILGKRVGERLERFDDYKEYAEYLR